jgi:hypothetical protein
MADDVVLHGEKADVYLDLPSDEKTVGGVCPFFVDVPFGDRWIKEWGLGQSFLHRAFDQAVG